VTPPRRQPEALVPKGGRVIIFRALRGIGDFVCVTPALRALRSARPDVEVTYLGLPGTAELVGRYPHYVDRFIESPGFPGLPERQPDPAATPAFVASMRAERFHLAIQLHGSGAVTNHIVAGFGARRTAGHYPPGSPPPDPETYLPWVESRSEIRRGLQLMEHLGWAHDDDRPEFRIAPGTQAPPIPGEYVVVHPGASDVTRRWTGRGFREVADALAEHGLRIVLTGTAAERRHNREIAEQLRRPAIDLTGRTSLDELGATLRGARLLIANDTGVSHVAVALGVPSVVVFTGSDWVRWAPLDSRRHAAIRGSAPKAEQRIVAEARRILGDEGLRRAA